MSAQWPESLPTLNLPLNWQKESGLIRTQMETGPDKVRRRSSAVAVPFSATLTVNGGERDTLESFHDDTLKGGALEFTMDDPRNDTQANFRFLSAPAFRQLAGGSSEERQYRVSLNIELIP